MIGNPVTRELLALKRVGGVRGSVTHGLVLTLEEEGRHDLCLYIMSDCYLVILTSDWLIHNNTYL